MPSILSFPVTIDELEELESRIKSLEDSRSKGVVESQSKSKLMAFA